MIFGYWYPFIFEFTKYLFIALLLITLGEIYFLARTGKIYAQRKLTDKLSNGDPNPVQIDVQNAYSYPVYIEFVDELPYQFQKRDFNKKTYLLPGEKKNLKYYLKPVVRGEYLFGNLNAFISTPLKLVKWRQQFKYSKKVKVYPGYIQMKKYELIALTKQRGAGLKKIRRLGHSLEFEHIKQYNKGDDYRTINWKATAKHRHLMVNRFQDQTSQNVYSIIDMGRTMKMPFEQMSLLDYAINSTLSFSNIVIKKHDKAGIITFERNIENFFKADHKKATLHHIFESLYKIETGFYETDYEKLYKFINHKIPNRSLLMIYTNFEHYSSFKRRLPYLKKIAKKHLVVVVIFENSEMEQLINQPTEKTSALYAKIIAEDFLRQKKRMIKEMKLHKIHAILTKPQNLTISTINKYLELKKRGLI
jgi:uncharacterized protein (DUF58 family)